MRGTKEEKQFWFRERKSNTLEKKELEERKLDKEETKKGEKKRTGLQKEKKVDPIRDFGKFGYVTI